MSENIILAIITVLGSGILSVVGSFLVYQAQAKRIPSQNFRDDMDTAKIALEISEKSTAKQLELEKKVETLEGILKNRHYKVTVIFSLGETPRVEQASIEAIPAVTQNHPV